MRLLPLDASAEACWEKALDLDRLAGLLNAFKERYGGDAARTGPEREDAHESADPNNGG